MRAVLQATMSAEQLQTVRHAFLAGCERYTRDHFRITTASFVVAASILPLTVHHHDIVFLCATAAWASTHLAVHALADSAIIRRALAAESGILEQSPLLPAARKQVAHYLRETSRIDIYWRWGLGSLCATAASAFAVDVLAGLAWTIATIS